MMKLMLKGLVSRSFDPLYVFMVAVQRPGGRLCNENVVHDNVLDV